jgi:lysozyme
MRISPTGLAIVKAFESCMQSVPGRPGYFKPYFDTGGVLTIGWGHTNHHEPKINTSTVWSQAECDAALARDIAIFDAHVAKHAKVPLSQYEFDALVSWSYNTGGPETATLWRKLNAGDRASVPRELAKWNKDNGRTLNGLVRRRKAEGELFSGNVAAALNTAGAKAPVKPPPDPVPVAQATPKSPPSWGGFFMSIAKLFKRA